MPTWIIKADRRQCDYQHIVERLQSLEQSVEGLTVSLMERTVFEASRDEGDFRDFAPLARLSHQSLEALEVIGEELLLEFGWHIDLSRSDKAT